MGENLCQLFIGQGIDIRIYEELKKKKLSFKRTNILINKGTNELDISKKLQMSNKRMFNILSHKGNTNQNDTYSTQSDGYH
jgi:hypothetical protein